MRHETPTFLADEPRFTVKLTVPMFVSVHALKPLLDSCLDWPSHEMSAYIVQPLMLPYWASMYAVMVTVACVALG